MKFHSMSCFDLDHTLLKANSCYSFGAYLFKNRVFSFPMMLYLAGCYWSHKVGILSIAALHRSIFKRLFLGRPFSMMQTYAKGFLNQQWDQLLYMPAVKALQEAKRQGHYTVILSSSPHFLVSVIAERLGADEWKATDYAVDENHFFCSIKQFLLGYDKASYLVYLEKKLGLLKKNITAYSDSSLDLSFLQAAGKAVGVNPDRKLRAICLKNGWDIL